MSLLDRLEQLVQANDTYSPNGPSARDYVRQAQQMGLLVQPITDSAGSAGAYYEVYALYQGEYTVFGRQPLGLIFEDFSRSVPSVWLAEFKPCQRAARDDVPAKPEGAPTCEECGDWIDEPVTKAEALAEWGWVQGPEGGIFCMECQ